MRSVREMVSQRTMPFSPEHCQPGLKGVRRSFPEKGTEIGRGKESTVVTPKCARCKNHGVICPLKGHKGLCRFKSCTCPNCSLIVERQKIMAAEQTVLKEMAGQSISNRTNPDLGALHSSSSSPGYGMLIILSFN